MGRTLHSLAGASRIRLAGIVVVVALAGVTLLSAAQQTPQGGAGVTVLPVQGNVHMIRGAGGNIAAQVGPDGVVLVDSGFADMADAALAAIVELTAQPIRYIINTGPSPDHIGGNGQIAGAGRSLFDRGGAEASPARGPTPVAPQSWVRRVCSSE